MISQTLLRKISAKSDINRLNNAFTYVSDDGKNMLWLDHVLCSPTLHKLIENISVLTDVVATDNRPFLNLLFSK